MILPNTPPSAVITPNDFDIRIDAIIMRSIGIGPPVTVEVVDPAPRFIS
jgi:hypothetical protein